MHEIPKPTLHGLAFLVVVAFDTARSGLHSTLERLLPHVRPPADLRVSSTRGHTYTGVVVIDDNDVLAGVVARTGRTIETAPSHRRSFSPLRRSSLQASFSDELEDEGDGDCRLPGWAEDPRGPSW